MTIYINMKQGSTIETVDEFPFNNRTERKYAADMLREYKMSDPYSSYYSSQRCTKEWRN